MRNKIMAVLLLSSIFVISNPVFGENDETCFYIGPTIGTGFVNAKYSAINPLTNDLTSAKGGVNSFLGGGVFGVQTTLVNNLFIAAQINMFYNSLNNTIRISTTTLGVRDQIIGVKNNFQYGFDGRIGLNLCNTVPYVLAGVEAGKWRMKLENESAISNRGISGNSKLSFSKRSVGPKIGLGILVPILCNINLNLEYNYSWFRKLRTVLVDGNGIAWTHDEKIRQNAVMLGLNWLF